MGKTYRKLKLKQAIFVGQASRFRWPEEAPYRQKWKTTRDLCGLSGSQVDSLFDKTNIFKEFPGRQCHPLKGDMFNI